MFRELKVRQGTYAVVSNPEFLREGHAVYDFLHPDRIVIGTSDKTPANILSELYRALNARLVFMDPTSAELVKYSSNAFLANKISFINEISNICEKSGADVKKVAEGMGYDQRIGHDFLRAGLGYGGSCLPKDVSALTFLAKSLGARAIILEAVNEVNLNQRKRFADKIARVIKDLKNKRIGIWGLAFKAQTDDIREAPSLYLIKSLLKDGAKITAYDPMAMAKTKKLFPQIKYLTDPYSVARDSDLLVIFTEWNEFREIDLARIKKIMRRPCIIDGRNIYSADALKELGIEYHGVGFGQ
jgi:UDPglucose 6-dehydrogenase